MAPHRLRDTREPGNPGRREHAGDGRPLYDPASDHPGADGEEARSAKVICRSEAIHPRHHANFRVFHPLDFLAEVSAHIPDAHEKTTLFYGWYSNRTRGYRKQHGLLGSAQPPDPGAHEGTQAPLELRRSWARLIRQVYAVDPLVCARCGGTMRVIAVIERQRVVRQILEHLGLPTRAPSLRAPPDQSNGLAGAHPREWSYEPLFDDLLPDPLLLQP